MLYPVELRALYLAKMTSTDDFYCLFYGRRNETMQHSAKRRSRGDGQCFDHRGADSSTGCGFFQPNFGHTSTGCRFSILSPGEKCESKNGMIEILSFSFWEAFCSAIHLAIGFCTTRAGLRELRPADAVLVRRRP
jgi:hypothetical protein